MPQEFIFRPLICCRLLQMLAKKCSVPFVCCLQSASLSGERFGQFVSSQSLCGLPRPDRTQILSINTSRVASSVSWCTCKQHSHFPGTLLFCSGHCKCKGFHREQHQNLRISCLMQLHVNRSCAIC